MRAEACETDKSPSFNNNLTPGFVCLAKRRSIARKSSQFEKTTEI